MDLKVTMLKKTYCTGTPSTKTKALPNMVSFDTDPIALVIVHVYFPLSLVVGDIIVRQLSSKLPSTLLF